MPSAQYLYDRARLLYHFNPLISICYTKGMDTDVMQKLRHTNLLNFFLSLPPSHQKEYLVWVTSAKKAETKQARIDKMIGMLRTKQAQVTKEAV
jgi:hypothetical protein